MATCAVVLACMCALLSPAPGSGADAAEETTSKEPSHQAPPSGPSDGGADAPASGADEGAHGHESPEEGAEPFGGHHHGRGGLVAPVPVLLTQPDGATFDAEPYGDAALHGYETLDGYTVVRDAGNVWRYAEGRLPNGKLRPGNRRPDRDPPPAKAAPHQRPDPSTAELPEDPPPPASPELDSGQVAPNVGTHKILVILAAFDDRPPVGSTQADWAGRFFGATNSVRHYYNEVSYGRLAVAPAAETHGTANDGVVGWVNLGYNHPKPGPGNWDPSRQITRDAIRAADPHVNFAAFDTNNDGYLAPHELHITVVTAGYEMAYGGPDGSCGASTWGHRWGTYDLTPTVDGKQVGYLGYTMFGEWHCSTGEPPGHMATIGIMVHEIGHDLGLPDLYDTDLSSEGVGYWSAMAAGTWGRVPGQPVGATPTHLDAWSKIAQGWVTPSRVTGRDVPFQTAATNADVKQLLANPNGVDWSMSLFSGGGASGTGEYFLVENRQNTGYDASLPGCGLLVWHVDETRPGDNSANANDARRLVDLEEADGLRHLDFRTNRGDAGDPYPGTSNNMLFGAGTNPNSNLYSGAASGVYVQPVSTGCAPTMTANLSETGAPPICPPDDTLEPNNTREQATRLERQRSVEGIACDDDYFAFHAHAGSTLSANMTFRHADGNLDMRVYNAAGTQVASSLTVTDDEAVSYTVPANQTGTYFIRVYGNDGARNRYTLTADHTICPPDDSFEPNDTIAQATPLTNNTPVRGITCGGNTDYYRISATGPGELQARLRFRHRIGDLDLRLRDAQGNVLATSAGTTDEEVIRHRVSSAGTYYLEAYGYQGAQNTYRLAATAGWEFVPVAPCAVFDTRSGTGGKLAGGVSRTFQVTGAVPAGQGGQGCKAPPSDAVAVELNLVATQAEAPGNLQIAAAGTTPQGGVVNFVAGVANSNALPVEVSGSGAVTVTNNTGGGRVHVRGVVLGYYTDVDAAGLEFLAVAPCAVFDTRYAAGGLGGKVAGGGSRTFQVTGSVPAGQGGQGCQAPPANAVAVKLNLVATEAEAPGNLQIAAAGVSPQGGVVNFVAGVANSNALPVQVSGSGAVTVTNNTGGGRVHVRGVVLGYYTDANATGLQFVAVAPCAVFDTRSGAGGFAGALAGGVSRTFQLTGAVPAGQGGQSCPAPPANAGAVEVNLVALEAAGSGNLQIAAAGVVPQGGVVNFTTGVANSNALPVKVSTAGAVDVTNNAGGGDVDVRGVVLGYYVEAAP